MRKRFAHANPMTANATPVFLCQLLGATHQPPDGVQSYYIVREKKNGERKLQWLYSNIMMHAMSRQRAIENRRYCFSIDLLSKYKVEDPPPTSRSHEVYLKPFE